MKKLNALLLISFAVLASSALNASVASGATDAAQPGLLKTGWDWTKNTASKVGGYLQDTANSIGARLVEPTEVAKKFLQNHKSEIIVGASAAVLTAATILIIQKLRARKQQEKAVPAFTGKGATQKRRHQGHRHSTGKSYNLYTRVA